MLTRCPACTTTFRVRPEQLKAKLGRVRCGECNTVFNALDALVEERPPTPVTVASTHLADDRSIAPEETGEGSAPAAGLAVAEPAVPQDDAPLPPLETLAGNADAIATEAPASEVPIAAQPVTSEAGEASSPMTDAIAEPSVPAEDITPQVSADTPPGEGPLPFLFEPALHETGPRRRWAWILASVGTAFLLLAQALLHYRVELAVLRPELKTLLGQACGMLGCELPLPQRIEQLSIESSDLQPVGDRKGILQFTALVRNRAPFPQEYPALELTLTDVADQALVVKSLAAKEYLPETQRASAGFAPGSDLTVNLRLDAGDTPAAGYRLYLYYP